MDKIRKIALTTYYPYGARKKQIIEERTLAVDKALEEYRAEVQTNAVLNFAEKLKKKFDAEFIDYDDNGEQTFESNPDLIWDAIEKVLAEYKKEADHLPVYQQGIEEGKQMTSALQIPQNPVMISAGTHNSEPSYVGWRCPSCKEFFDIDEEAYKYCPECGQRLRWN